MTKDELLQLTAFFAGRMSTLLFGNKTVATIENKQFRHLALLTFISMKQDIFTTEDETEELSINEIFKALGLSKNEDKTTN